jgi:hypothetical protein
MYCSTNNGDFYSFNISSLTWSAKTNPSGTTALDMHEITSAIVRGYLTDAHNLFYIYPLNETLSNQHVFYTTTDTLGIVALNANQTAAEYDFAYEVISINPFALKWSAQSALHAHMMFFVTVTTTVNVGQSSGIDFSVLYALAIVAILLGLTVGIIRVARSVRT